MRVGRPEDQRGGEGSPRPPVAVADRATRGAIGPTAAFFLAAAVAAALLPSALAAAQPRSEADQRFAEGVALFQWGNYSGALAAFEASYAADPALDTLFNIAMCQRAVEDFSSSINSFHLYLLAAGAALPQEDQGEIDRQLDEMLPHVARLEFDVGPQDARVWLDGREVTDLLPAGFVAAPPGRHVVTARREGFRDAEATVDAVAQLIVRVTLEMEAVVPAGHVIIDTTARVGILFVDGVGPASLPYEADLPAGSHTFWIAAAGYEPYEEVLTVIPGGRIERLISLIPLGWPIPEDLRDGAEPSPASAEAAPGAASSEEPPGIVRASGGLPPDEGLGCDWFWASVLATGALSVVAATSAVTAAWADQRAQDPFISWRRASELRSDSHDLGTAAVSLGAAAGVAALVATVLWFLTDFDDDPSGHDDALPIDAVTPMPGTGGIGMPPLALAVVAF